MYDCNLYPVTRNSKLVENNCQDLHNLKKEGERKGDSIMYDYASITGMTLLIAAGICIDSNSLIPH